MSARRARLRIAPRAQQDIRGIRLYSLERWGEKRAAEYQAEIGRGIDALRANPLLGVERDDLFRGLRFHSVARHVLFYRVVDGMVEIVRILQARQDASAAFGDERRS